MNKYQILYSDVWLRRVLSCVLILMFALVAHAQKQQKAERFTINGYVADAKSGERLIGATLMDTISRNGTVTNNGGFYSITLPKGEVALSVSYVGYTPENIKFELTKDTLINFLIHDNTQLSEVTITGHQSISGPQSVQMSVIEVPVQQIKGIPALGGEVDVLKAIQLLPGVQSGSEGSAGVYVRGGGPDENLIMLDGVPLYNVNHMMGFFSVFNADAIKNVTLYKGNFPARFGSRLSSVIDVRQNDGNAQSYHGNVTVGLIAAKVNVEGPIIKGKTTFNVSTRRTYFDLFTAPIMALITRNEMDGTGSASAGYYFYDVNAKLTHRFSDNDKLSASFYMGDDAIYVHYRDRELSSSSKERINVDWNWGNILAAASWEHRFSPKLFSTTQLSFTRYRYDLTQKLDAEYKEDSNSPAYTLKESLQYKSKIMDVMLQSNFDYAFSPQHDMKFGVSYTYHNFSPQVTSLNMFGNDPSESLALDTTISDGRLNAHEATLYFEDTYQPVSWFKMNLGLHGSIYGVNGKVYPSIEPRIGLRALITNDLAIKASYAYMSQYIHLLSNSSVSLPTDLWVPVTKQIEPMRSMQVAGGLSYNVLGQVELSVEGYYKKMKNLLEYKEGASFLGSSVGWEDQVCMGDGWSYGVEFMAQRTIGKFTGWLAYTWSRTMRLFNREGQELNFGRPFHARYDREHDLSLTLQYQINKRIDISGTFIFSTGNRATLSTQSYYDDKKTSSDAVINYYESRNNYIMPNYHRLDLGANFHIPHHKWSNAEHVVNVSVYNVYNSMNPFLLAPDTYFGKLYKVTLFPILPSLSYTFKF